MFADIDETNFPIIKVTLSGSCKTEKDIDKLLDKWEELYNKKQYFIFIFDTRNLGIINPKYCLKMTLFIKNIKKRSVQYLKHSIIIVSNKKTRSLLWLIFTMQKPVSPVYITDIPQDIFIKLINNNIKNGIKIPDCVEIINS